MQVCFVVSGRLAVATAGPRREPSGKAVGRQVTRARHRTVTVTVSDTTLAIDLGDGDVKVVRRTTTQPVRSIKGQRPRIAISIS